MGRILYFVHNEVIINYAVDKITDHCSGEVYRDFIDYAFSESDYFMLAYVNYYRQGYSKFSKEIRAALKRFKVKSRSDPRRPGTMQIYTPDTDYKIEFYKTDDKAKEVLKRVSCLSDWSRPSNPEDLAFFKKNKCWFYSVGHENIAEIIDPTEKDIEFLKEHNIPIAVEELNDEQMACYDYCNEQIE